MSPLVRSLLALAALFATAVTQDPPLPPNCTEKIFGQVTNIKVPLVPVQVPPPGGTVDVKNFCPFDYHPVGEKVLACNNLGPYSSPPLVYLENSPDLEKVKVVCTDGCPFGLTVTVTQYCGPNWSG